MRRISVSLGLAFSLVLGSLGSLPGCAARSQPARWERATAALPSSALGILRDRALRLTSLRALVRIRYRDPEQSFSSREAVLIARPDRVRVEALSWFGAAFVLTTDEQNLLAYVPRENTAYVGKASAENLWRYTGLWIPVEELVDLVLATPGHRGSALAECPRERNDAAHCLVYEGALGRGLVWLNEEAVPVEVEQGGRDGTVLWAAKYESFQAGSPVPIVEKLVLEAPVFRRSVTLQFHDIEVNPTLKGDEFQVSLPAGSRVVHLEGESLP